jgi:hypothetical protein
MPPSFFPDGPARAGGDFNSTPSPRANQGFPLGISLLGPSNLKPLTPTSQADEVGLARTASTNMLQK